MKPASFEYYDPPTAMEAVALLGGLGEDARVLAGGQSLVPLMNFRLARPAHLVDLNHVTELDFVSVAGGELHIGAMTRQRTLERSEEAAAGWPLLREAAGFIGHVQIRNRGTVGGSLAHAFPSAELPVAMVTLDAGVVLQGEGGERTVAAEDFFLGTMTTALEPGELLREVRVPAVAAGSGASFQEVSRRYGDFALAGAAALVTLDRDGAVSGARLTLTGSAPIRARDAEAAVLGEKPSDALFREAARRAVEGIDQESDMHASADYRRRTCAALARRALAQAARQAAAATGSGQ
ncbi:MAG: xanthine dehydrogenase family protein subunit M [Deltaproteobacteria bacterium]|nr:xanthine dehydrogenase family protein subunit M [Deltaproteobacteria bacterium]